MELSSVIIVCIVSWCVSKDLVECKLRFANYYQDHMILQRAPERSIVWGYTDTDTMNNQSQIELTMNNRTYSTLSHNSTWSITLDAQIEQGPFEIYVSQLLSNGTSERIMLNDILFGDVWLCSGQSNMHFNVTRMFNASNEIQNANQYPQIRLFSSQYSINNEQQEDLKYIAMNWSIASNETLQNPAVSAVCWLYGRMISDALERRPIGLIRSSWSGTNIELWSPSNVLIECNITSSVNPVPSINSTMLFNTMIYPFTRMVIKGIVWYQGENNVGHNMDKYNCTFFNLIQSWRNIWFTRTQSNTNPHFPFGFVQLSTGETTGTIVGGFPVIRWHQTFDVGSVPNSILPNLFMAVTLDLRDDQGG